MPGTGHGFVMDAIRKIKANRAVLTSKGRKFKGNYSEDTILKSKRSKRLVFPKLSKRQVAQERERIRVRHEKRKKNRIWILSIGLVITIIGVTVLGIVTEGFEYWEFLRSY